jgi:flavin reductase (DIM6/NTAB) family NADH-FMN oxidoreductase RutF
MMPPMPKTQLKPSTFLLPTPAILVTSRDQRGVANVLTIAWTGVLCSDPPMLSISIRPSRLSHKVIKETGEFVANMPPAALVKQVDLCGNVSGRVANKFTMAGLTEEKAAIVQAPLIAECPVSLECRVTEVIPLGAHDLFLAEIVQAHVDEKLVDGRGRVNTESIAPLAYCPTDHTYRSLGDVIGKYGFAKE